jgi:hypothetical protein
MYTEEKLAYTGHLQRPYKKTDEKNFLKAMLLIQIDPVFIWHRKSG